MTFEERTSDGWFAESAFFQALRGDVVPRLRTHPSVMVWLPACGRGELAYQVAIVLREERLSQRFFIYATNRAESELSRARAGVYPIEDVAGARAAYRESGGRATLDEYFFRDGDSAVMRPLLRDRIAFFEHDCSADASFNEFQLILGRTALSGAAAASGDRVCRLMDESLCRSGVLAVDRGSRLARLSPGAAYVPVDPAHFFHRKVA